MKNLVSDLDELRKLLCKINETLGDPARSEFITDNLP